MIAPGFQQSPVMSAQGWCGEYSQKAQATVMKTTP
jgi:hypothetical protein